MAYTFFAITAGAKFYGGTSGLPASDIFASAVLHFIFSHGLYHFVGQGKTEGPGLWKLRRKDANRIFEEDKPRRVD